jgi:hypothetical protein
MEKLELEQLEERVGNTLFDCRGDRIGPIDSVYVNEATGVPEWIRVPVGPLGTRSTLVPVERLEVRDQDLAVSHDMAFVKAAPVYLEPYGTLPPGEEARLFEYYGLHPSQFGRPHAAVPRR